MIKVMLRIAIIFIIWPIIVACWVQEDAAVKCSTALRFSCNMIGMSYPVWLMYALRMSPHDISKTPSLCGTLSGFCNLTAPD